MKQAKVKIFLYAIVTLSVAHQAVCTPQVETINTHIPSKLTYFCVHATTQLAATALSLAMFAYATRILLEITKPAISCPHHQEGLVRKACLILVPTWAAATYITEKTAQWTDKCLWGYEQKRSLSEKTTSFCINGCRYALLPLIAFMLSGQHVCCIDCYGK